MKGRKTKDMSYAKKSICWFGCFVACVITILAVRGQNPITLVPLTKTITLAWEYPTEQATNVNGFVLYDLVQSQTNRLQAVDGLQRTLIVTLSRRLQPYNLFLTATNSLGESEPSNVLKLFLFPPFPPINLHRIQ